MGLITSYNLRSMLARKATAAMTLMGIAMVVAVFVMTLAIAQGFRATLVSSGSPQNAIVLRKGATAETVSSVLRPQLPLIETLPQVARGADGHGLPAMRCNSCHQQANFDPGRVPGHPEWHLAPREMAWEGKTLAEICAQIKDPARNGGRKVEDLIHHIADDTLVGWAWAPGYGRQPAPGTQKQAGALVEAWVKTGAACPTQ